MGKKRTKREKNFPRHVVTGVAVTSLAFGVLTNASGLENLFKPQNYKQFEKKLQKKNSDYAAGKGKDTDLADKNQKKQKNSGDDLSQALKMAQNPSQNASSNHSSLNLSDHENSSDQTKNPNAVSISNTDGNDTINTNPTNSSDDTSSDHNTASSDTANDTDHSSDDTTSNTPGDSTNDSQTPGSDNSNTNTPTKPDHSSDSDDSDSDTKTDWEKEQLVRKDPEETKYGKLTKLDAVITKDEYALGESFSGKDAVVTGTFIKDGNTYTKELPFIDDSNENDGYEVSLRTNVEGKGTAVFTYNGKSARSSYSVSSYHINVHFYIYYNQNYYSSVFTGNLFDFLEADIQDYLTKLNSKPYTFSKAGNIIDLSNMHHRMIAYLLNDQVKNTFSKIETGSYKNINFLEEDSDGYLTSMLEGFRFITNLQIVDSQSYIYYPSAKDIWNYPASSKNISDVIVAVPQGYKIRRVTQSEDDWTDYNGDQVLEQYTGSSENLEVPMGVTKINLIKTPENASVTTLTLPESVDAIDTASIAEHLKDLQQYAYKDPEDERSIAHLNYKIVDGVLYSADGSTLLSVPPGRTKKLVIPSTVTTLAKDCFKNVALDKIYFEDETPPAIAGDTGYRGKIIVPETGYDQACKDYMFCFKTECDQIEFTSSDTENSKYTYDADTDTICKKDDPTTLCAISPDAKGLYTIDSKYHTIEAAAFIHRTAVTDIDCGKNIKKLKNQSLLSSNIGSISFKNSDVEIEPYIFGNPQNGAVVPNIKFYVYATDYETYLEKWSEILDPVYGVGTTKNILSESNSNIIYEDGIKYEKYKEGSLTRYRVLKVYEPDKTAIKLKDGTTSITDGAFENCKKLEILYLPSTLQEFDTDLINNCSNMETIVNASSDLSISVTDSAVEIFNKGFDYQDFVYENGIIYGQSMDGTYTLLNIPSDTTGEVVIREKTKKLYNKAFTSCNKLTAIKLLDENALEEIGAYCFEKNQIITQLDFSKCDHLKLVGDGAFKDCTYLVEVKLPDTVTVLNDRSFENCTNLTSITGNGITQIKDEVFTECMILQNLLGFDDVESIGDFAFYNCQSLHDFVSGEKLSKIGEECFGNCVNLQKVNLNGTLTVISRYCFNGCVNLSEFAMNDQQSERLKMIGVEAFANCSSLTQLDFSNDTSLTQLGEGCFSNCSSMLRIKFPKSLDTIAADSFSGCTALSELQLNSTDVVTLNIQAFGEKVPIYLHVLVPEEAVDSYIKTYQTTLDQQYGDGTAAKLFGKIDASTQYLKGIQYEITDEGLVLKKVTDAFEGELTVPEDTIRIADDAFNDCQNITALTIPYGSKMELGNRCFKNCKNLKTLTIYGDIPAWGEETFMGCSGLNKAYIGYSTSSIPRIGTRAFMNCTGFSTAGAVTLAAKIPVIGKECFSGCSNLLAFSYIKGTDGLYSYTSIETIEDSAFENCTKLPGFLISGFTGLKTIGNYAFKGCTSLTGPSVPKNVTSIGEGCFMNCTGASYISFYGAIEEYPKDCFKNCTKLIRTGGTAAAFSGLKRIGESAYEGCTSLTSNSSWYLERYANLEEIGDSAFKGCTNLGPSVLSSTIYKIGSYAFDGCSNLSTLTFKGTKAPSIGVFSPESMGDGFMIKVPDSKESDDAVYKAYFEQLKSALGTEDKVYKILDSISDGAKGRNTPSVSKEETESESTQTEEDKSANNEETNNDH